MVGKNGQQATMFVFLLVCEEDVRGGEEKAKIFSSVWDVQCLISEEIDVQWPISSKNIILIDQRRQPGYLYLGLGLFIYSRQPLLAP